MSTKDQELEALKKALQREQKKNAALKQKMEAQKAEIKKVQREAKKKEDARSQISSEKVKEVLKIIFPDTDL